MRIHLRRTLVNSITTVAILVGIWFAGIETSAYYEGCSYCDSRRIAVETRAFGVLVASRFHSHRESFQARIAEDLGAPCPHCFLRELLGRRRGLVLPTIRKNIPLTLLPVPVPDWYRKNAPMIIAELKRRNPALPDEFQRKALLTKDEEYLRGLIESMHQLLPRTERADWE